MPADPKGRTVSGPVTVTEFNTVARRLLVDSGALRDVWVSGEISNLKRSAAGHYYFTLKDEGSELSCTLFRGVASRLKRTPEDKEKVVAFGHADLYLPRGSYQFNVADLRAEGIGDLHARFQELKERLREEGLFDEERKRPLPRYPDRVGVVTSSTGSVIRDIINVASRRYPCEIVLAPAQVQGENAARSIVKAMGSLEVLGVDVMIIGRGGGSLEDLWPFNEETVARAVHACAVPVISAVGHETDFSISDFVADRRAETPSAAAEMALPDLSLELRHLMQVSLHADRALARRLKDAGRDFRAADQRLAPRRAAERLAQMMQRADELSALAAKAAAARSERLAARLDRWEYRLSPLHAADDIASAARSCDELGRRADASAARLMRDRRSALESLEGRMEALDPLRVLDRGYGMLLDQEGSPVGSVRSVDPGDTVTVRMHDGSLRAEVRDKEVY